MVVAWLSVGLGWAWCNPPTPTPSPITPCVIYVGIIHKERTNYSRDSQGPAVPSTLTYRSRFWRAPSVCPPNPSRPGTSSPQAGLGIVWQGEHDRNCKFMRIFPFLWTRKSKRHARLGEERPREKKKNNIKKEKKTYTSIGRRRYVNRSNFQRGENVNEWPNPPGIALVDNRAAGQVRVVWYEQKYMHWPRVGNPNNDSNGKSSMDPVDGSWKEHYTNINYVRKLSTVLYVVIPLVDISIPLPLPVL